MQSVHTAAHIRIFIVEPTQECRAVQCSATLRGMEVFSGVTKAPVAQTLAVEHSVMAGDNHFGSFNFFYPTYNLRDLFVAK